MWNFKKNRLSKICFLVILSLNVYGQSSLTIGVFSNNYDSHYLSFFDDGTFTLIENQSTYPDQRMFYFQYNCDTISYGRWSKIDKKTIFIKSEYDLLNNNLEAEIKTSTRESSDSIYLKFTNKYAKDFSYSIDFENADPEFDKYSIILFKNDIFTYENETKDNSLKVIVDLNRHGPFIPVNTYGQFLGAINFVSEFEIDLTKGNYFEIEFPQINLCFLERERIVGDYIRVDNENTLIWNGEVFKK